MSQPPGAGLNLHGAVDLSALARPAAPARPQGPGAAAPDGTPGAPDGAAPAGPDGGTVVPGPYAVTLDEASLPSVVETSAVVPVVVVVYAGRSAATVQLADDLVEIAAEMEGRFQVARVDADTDPSLVQALQVQALPSVLILLAGQPVPAFQGTADKDQVRTIMGQVLQVAAESGITGRVDGDADAVPAEPAEPPMDPLVAEGLAAVEAGDLDAARAAFAKAVTENPRDDEARAALAQVDLMLRVTAADPDEALAAAQDAPYTEVETHLRAADVEVTTGRAVAGLERVLEVVRAVYGAERETARERLVELFDVVGSNTPEVADVRRRLASALY